MNCIVCQPLQAAGAISICDDCRSRMATHYTDPEFLKVLMDGCIQGRTSHLMVARGAVRIADAQKELGSYYFSRPERRRGTFLERYNSGTAHPELYAILGPVSVREIQKWR